MNFDNLSITKHKIVPLILLASIFLSGCGNLITADMRGRVGFLQDNEGNIFIAVQPCGLKIDSVSISGAYNSLTNDNKVYAEFKAKESIDDFFIIDLEEPDENWEPTIPIQLPPNDENLLLGNAWVSGKDAQSRQVTRTLGQVTALMEGQILAGDSAPPLTMEEFKKCATR